jgi:hypothetical protein
MGSRVDYDLGANAPAVPVGLWSHRCASNALQQVLYALCLERFAVGSFVPTGIEALGDLSQGCHVRGPDFLHDRNQPPGVGIRRC